MFVLIGGEPLTAGVEDWLRCDAGGYLMTGPELYAEADRDWWPLARDPLFLESTARAVRRGRRPPRFDQASRVGSGRRRNVDLAGAQLPVVAWRVAPHVGVKEVRLVSQHDRLDAVTEAQLLEDVRDVRLDRRVADVELLADLRVGEAPRDQSQHVQFTI